MMTTQSPPTDQPSLCFERKALLAAAVVFLIGLGISYPFMERLDALGAFDQYNILFDSDANAALAAISHGWGRNYKHWNLTTFFSVPIRIVSKPAALLSGAPEEAIRRKLGLLVAPVLSAATGPLVLVACLLLGLPLRYALLVALVNQVCASRVVFGSASDSFAISAFAIALWIALAAGNIRNASSNPRLAWIAAGVFGFGITVTNLMSFCASWLLSRFELPAELRPALLSTAKMAILVVAINAPILAVSALVYGEDMNRFVQRAGQDVHYSSKFGDSLEELPFAIAYTLAGPAPAVVPEPIAVRENLRIQTMFRYASTPRNTLESLAYLAFAGTLFVLGAAGWYRAGGARRRFGMLCLLLVFLNSILHLFYRGLDLFLYSQHWQVPMVMVAAGIYFLTPEREKLAEVAMIAVLGICVWRSYALVELMVTTLLPAHG
jgi:hypothetical protein